MQDLPAYAKKGSESVARDGWGEAGAKFVSAIEEELKRG